MKNRNYKFYIRKSHRYLGVFIGVQFLLWTNIEEIRGGHLRREKAEIDFQRNLISPETVVENIKKREDVSAIKGMRFIEVFDMPFYEFDVRDKTKKREFIVSDAVRGT